jgi:dihydrodipicolinate synthase/N-acetylneuraminate lyase
MVTRNERRELIRQLLPDGIPRLWCPLLTHYKDDGAIDFPRMTAHYNHIVPWVRGYLMPGSTGDGWDLDHEETMKVVDFAIRMARKHNTRVLLGVLRADTDSMKKTIDDMLIVLGSLAGTDDILPAFLHTHVCGFTVCPPTGPSIDQGTIRTELSIILDLGVPTALYQLPQVTQNEASPETFAALAETYSNLIFFKDSSGKDGIALSDADPRGVYLVRGAEGEYAHWLKDAGGRYDGFLLSTANCFPSHLMNIILSLEAGDSDSARGLSDRISGVISEMFEVVRGVPCGNAFTNANKAIDHYCAFGPTAMKHGGPLLHGGIRLSADTLSKTGDILSRHDLMPARGYLE